MKYLFIAILLALSLQANADGFSSPKEARDFADKTMDLFIKKKFSEGLNAAKIYWPLPSIEIDGLANKINQQWPIVDQRFGKVTGKEFIRAEKIGNSFIRYFYLHKFENHAIYWRFDFYKPKDKWKINSIVFLDDLGVLYE